MLKTTEEYKKKSIHDIREKIVTKSIVLIEKKRNYRYSMNSMAHLQVQMT